MSVTLLSPNYQATVLSTCAWCRRRRPARKSPLATSQTEQQRPKRCGKMVEPGKGEGTPNRASSKDGEKWAVCRGVAGYISRTRVSTLALAYASHGNSNCSV